MVSAYSLILDHTRQTFHLRSVQYKRLALVIIGISISSLMMTFWCDGGLAVSCVLVPAAITIHHGFDQRAVAEWRTAVLSEWSTSNLDLAILSGMLTRVPGFPSSTLTGMIEILPRWPGDASAIQRHASIELHSRIVRRCNFASWASTVVLLWAVASTATAYWLNPAATLALALIPAGLSVFRRSSISTVRQAVATFDAVVIADLADDSLAARSLQARRWNELRQACFATADIPPWLRL
jgi:hypothetical protein